ncbi:MAG: hypothetical protein GWM98_29680 [Nitrospinaceae bacterium]|nr:hypothetical protein [Nitrospinaceae bacterium]NIS88328.1 hypothetical protein [Nitrospinaceae bacterium]NIT85206.1 hypothetical protein [Nitrospinaceae bacterium]NIU47356.1 hypothetical protein [Nitrospinaceae bacterium]NIU99576.1 hypothetical protein [Nitrospinaceae bacterium]
MDINILIIDCPGCGVKNRVKAYTADRIPVCAKCGTRLVEEENNEAHARYADHLKKFYDLPDFNARDPE